MLLMSAVNTNLRSMIVDSFSASVGKPTPRRAARRQTAHSTWRSSVRPRS
jgi:hypothetical protein